MNEMKEIYSQPQAEILEIEEGTLICESRSSGFGGSTGDYSEDNEFGLSQL